MTKRYFSVPFLKRDGLFYCAGTFGESDLCKEMAVNEKSERSVFSLIIVRDAYVVV